MLENQDWGKIFSKQTHYKDYFEGSIPPPPSPHNPGKVHWKKDKGKGDIEGRSLKKTLKRKNIIPTSLFLFHANIYLLVTSLKSFS